MDWLYSFFLLCSFVSVGLALCAFLFRRTRRRRLILGPAVLGASLLVGSVAIHRIYGHGESSVSPMDWEAFVAAHPAFLVAALPALVAFWMSRKL